MIFLNEFEKFLVNNKEKEAHILRGIRIKSIIDDICKYFANLKLYIELK